MLLVLFWLAMICLSTYVTVEFSRYEIDIDVTFFTLVVFLSTFAWVILIPVFGFGCIVRKLVHYFNASNSNILWTKKK